MRTRMWRTLIVLSLVITIQGDEEDWKTLKTRQGPVRGRKDPAGLYIYSNIPYATAPKGKYKFSAPLPPSAWLELIETPDKPIICPQDITPFMDPESVVMQEDCLIANVYVPVTNEKKLPVLVYIHGGAFEIGFGDMMTPKNFAMDNKVIVVTFNYRLGVHGFLCLGTDVVPGNAGLKDQVALLTWVKRNIDSYGGNPEEVTIAGYSAGSVSVDLLMLTKHAKRLFKKVILESGAAVGSIAIQSDPLENAKTYARKHNCTDVDDVYALEEFYKNTPLETLIGNSFFNRKDASVLFGPCIERKSDSALISDSPINIIKKGKYKKIPILLGISNREGLLQVPMFNDWKDPMNEKFSDFLPSDLHFESEDEKEYTAKVIKEYYFAGRPVSEDTILAYIDYFSDVLFTYPTLRAVKEHAEKGHEEIYLYEYAFVDNYTALIPHTEIRGTGHCAQTVAILDGTGFTGGVGESDLSEEFKKMKTTMRAIWNNFVVHSKPVPEVSSLPSWPSAGADRSPYMSLGQTVKLQGPLLEHRARFWDNIYEKYYREPIPPPKPPHTEL